MQHATFIFHAELNDFLPRKQRHQPVEHRFNRRSSVKDMIEAHGVPHPEIELLVANGTSIDFDHIVTDGDIIHIYSCFAALDLPERVRLRPPIPDPPTFILDIHLGRLAAYLRMLGFDTFYGDSRDHTNFHDADLARIAGQQSRIMLTRDIGLLKRSDVVYGYWVRNSDPRKRLTEIIERFDLAARVQLFKHCMKCNGYLEPVAKDTILHRIEPKTAVHFDEFHHCTSCERIFWKGSHFDRMQALIADVLS